MVPARFTHPLDLNYHPSIPRLPSFCNFLLFSYYFPFLFGFSIIPIYANFSAFNSRHIFFHLFYLFLGNLLTHPDTPANSWKRLKFSSCFVIHQKYLVLLCIDSPFSRMGGWCLGSRHVQLMLTGLRLLSVEIFTHPFGIQLYFLH